MAHRRFLQAPAAVAVLASLAALATLTLSGCLEFQQTRYEYTEKAFGYTEVDGVRMHVRETPAPPDSKGNVVFIHGFAGGLVSWLYTQPRLAPHFRTLSADLKGFGLTDKMAGDYSLAAEADLIVHLMDQKGIDKAHLVAHSWGCAVALELARRHPDRVGKLVLTSGFVYEDQLNGFLRWSRVPGIGETLFALFYNAQLEARYTWSYFEPERHVSAKGFGYLHDFQETPGIKAAALAVLRGMELPSLRPALPQIQNEALLVWGREDRVSPPPYGERLVTELPHARLVVMERSGHNVMLERAGTYDALVEEFLSR